MGKKNKGNVYCESCKKFHKEDLHTKKFVKSLTDDDIKSVASLLKRCTAGMYITRDRIGDDKLFNESDIIKEDGDDEPKRNKEENK